MGKVYGVHRTSVSPLYINTGVEQNGLPALLTAGEYNQFAKDPELRKDMQALPHDFWINDKEADDEYIALLEKNGVNKESYMFLREQNYKEQLDKYFENGLYIQREDLNTTVTILGTRGKDAKKELEDILKQEGFGFRTNKDGLLGGLSNRENLNVAIILEIPEECLSIEGQKPVFENAKTPLEIMTVYYGPQRLTRVIPSQYLKGAYVINGKNDQILVQNPNFDNNYIIQNGYYDSNTMHTYIQRELDGEFNVRKLSKLINYLDAAFKATGDEMFYNGMRNVQDKVLENLGTEGADELYVEIEDKLYDAERSLRNPLEIAADDLAESNLENLPEKQLEQKIVNYLTQTKKILHGQENLGVYDKPINNVDESLEKGLNCLTPQVFEKLSHSRKYNDLTGEVNSLKKILNRKKELGSEWENLRVEQLGTTGEMRAQIEKKIEEIEKEVTLLNYGIFANKTTRQEIFKLIENGELEKLTKDDCFKWIDEQKKGVTTKSTKTTKTINK